MNKVLEKTNPTNHTIFDPWNSGSTGHQRADGPTVSQTTAWRDTRTEKLERQFALGDCSKGRNGDGKEKGEWRWVKDEDEAGRKGGKGRDIRDFMGGVRKTTTENNGVPGKEKERNIAGMGMGMGVGIAKWPTRDTYTLPPPETTSPPPAPTAPSNPRNNKKVLTGTTIYVNGSTMPLISDHKLKHLLTAHGARLSLTLARTTVTHVIVGRPSASGKGAGGGLAAGKMQKEIERCARGVKIVGVEWALESIKAEKRLAESRFALDLAPRGQRSVAGMFR